MSARCVDELLKPPYRSKRERWAGFYLLEPPVALFESPKREAQYWRIRRELQAEVRAFGYIRGEAPALPAAVPSPPPESLEERETPTTRKERR